MKDERTRASRRRFKEGQLRPVLRPIVAGCAVLLILVGWLVLLMMNLGGPPYDTEARIGWSLVGVGVVLLLWALLSGVFERRKRERARAERAQIGRRGPGER
jgi:protein-S-isoprenylcysteine O-methyltransferase Ste14